MPGTLSIRLASSADVNLLADMNLQLIEDEHYDRQFTIDQLRERIADLMSTDYSGFLFEEDGEIVGYALVHMKMDPMYVRHFFICRHKRRQGYGRHFFHDLLKLLGIKTVDLDVMIWNETGKAFWNNLGFKPRCLSMRYGA